MTLASYAMIRHFETLMGNQSVTFAYALLYTAFGLVLFYLTVVPLLFWFIPRRPTISGRKLIWLQTLFLTLVSIPFAVCMAKTFDSFSYLYLSYSWSNGYLHCALAVNILTLLISYPRHRKLLLHSTLPLCPVCAYNLTGTLTTSSAACPECGAPSRPTS